MDVINYDDGNFVTPTLKEKKLKNITIFTFYNENAKVFNEEKTELKLMKGKIDGKIETLKEFLTIIGVSTALIAGGYLAYQADNVIDNYIKTTEINKNAQENYSFYAESLDTFILLEFVNDVKAHLLEREALCLNTDDDISLIFELQEGLGKIDEIQTKILEAKATDNEEVLNEYTSQLKMVVSSLVITCGKRGHVIGGTDYYKYIHALYYDGRVMYKASDVSLDEISSEDTITYSINGEQYITTPKQDAQQKNML